MAGYMNQRQMETLSTSLKPSTRKKKITNQSAGKNSFYRPTQGKIVPVMKRNNPYKPIAGSTTSPGNTNAQGVAAQANQVANKAPVSTALNVSYESDPVLARIKALGTQDVANARSEAEALKKKAIIESGLGDIGTEIGLDAGTVQAAAANPFSTRATIERQGMERGRELDESLNQQNLFYGGHRANQLTDLARNQAAAQAGLQTDIRSLLGGINSGVTEAEQSALIREQEAMAQVAEQERLAALQQSYLDAMYADPLADPLAAPAAASLAGPVDPYADAFISQDTAALAGVSPYGYDPYEEELQRALGMNATPGLPIRQF